MKKIGLFCLAILLGFPSLLRAETKPIDLLNAMTQAHKKTNYELRYVIFQNDDLESFQYRHIFQHDKEYGQLLRLDNADEEIILRDGVVSYLGYYFKPFSLKSTYILDNLPAVIYTDFNQLTGYSFIPMGKARIANRIANVVKIVPSDNSRYQYTLWIDDENHLLLKSELLGRENHLLEQFKVVSQFTGNDLLYAIPTIEAISTPPLAANLEPSKQNNSKISWQPAWLPEGFKLITQSKQSFETDLGNKISIESQLYSDGIFAFTLYVLPPEEGLEEQLLKQGKTTIFSHSSKERNIVVIGDIPQESARQIALSITF